MHLTDIRVNGRTQVAVNREGQITLRLHIDVRRRSASKRVIGGNVATASQPESCVTPFQLAVALGHRWLDMLDSGEATSVKHLARLEKTDPSKVSRFVNLTTLDPSIVQQILDDTLPERLTLLELAIGSAPDWKLSTQRA